MTTIVHLFGSLDAGGAELRMLELMRGRQQSDQHHIFVTMSGRPGALAPEFEAAGCEVVARKLDVSFGLWLVRFLRNRQVTHLHSHVHLASGYLLALGSCAGIRRRIAHLRSSSDGQSDSVWRRLYRLVGRFLLAMVATDVVAVSESTLSAVTGIEPREHHKYRVLYGQVSGARFPLAGQAEPSQAHILIVGRLDRDKNPLRALEVLATLLERNPELDATIRFVGRATADEATALRQRASELGIVERVVFLGVRYDIPELLAASDLLISTTLREGLPGATIEAAAAGLPCVVSAIPPNEELSSLLPSVVTVPLEATNDIWSDVIADVVAQRCERLRPVVIRAWFEASPFALGDQKEWDRLWS